MMQKSIFLPIIPANANNGRISSKRLKTLQEEINTDFKGKRKPAGKRLAITHKDGLLNVSIARPQLPAVKFTLGGFHYVRSGTVQGNYSMEKILRHGSNLETFVKGVRRIAKEGLSSGELLVKREFPNPKNKGLSDLEGMCRKVDEGGLNPSDFTDTKGNRMKANQAFGYLIRQFFADIDFAQKVFSRAHSDYARKRL